jgi:putative pyruvate formate lyase activating enzyme
MTKETNFDETEMTGGCVLCPRMCRVNREEGKRGYCKESSDLVVARAALHMWEETCISGKEGSGAVFFSGCPMGCVFCQNSNIAAGKAGQVITVKRLSEIFLELQGKGANNINLVTPTHYVPQILKALQQAKEKGMNLPVVYNTSGYERVETLQMLKGAVDIYLPDFKYMDGNLAKEYSKAEDYPEYAKRALAEMVDQVGDPVFDPKTGLMKRGVIVRHLVLPGHVKDSKEVIHYLHETYGNKIYISIMNQYTPLPQVKDHPLLHRKVTAREYERVLDYALEIGVEQGFMQTGETAAESFIPEFDGEGVQ